MKDNIIVAKNQKNIVLISEIEDYIESNLQSDITLQFIANKAHFSDYHFHRVFKAINGETLNTFVTRLRIEKAAEMLFYSKRYKIKDISQQCGYKNLSAFTRAFKSRFNLSPTDFLKKQSECMNDCIQYGIEYTPFSKSTDKELSPEHIEVKFVSGFNVIYNRYRGAYEGNIDIFSKLFEPLYLWAVSRNALDIGTSKWITLHHFDRFSEQKNKRVSACLLLENDIETNGEISKLFVAGGLYAIARFHLNNASYSLAWNYMLQKWLIHSDYEIDQRYSFKLYPSPQNHDFDNHVVDLYLPIKHC